MIATYHASLQERGANGSLNDGGIVEGCRRIAHVDEFQTRQKVLINTT
jgi:hypothetical protein